MTRHLVGSALDEAELLARVAGAGAASELGHIDTLHGARVYVRDADRAARYLGAGSLVLDWGAGAGQMSWLLARRGLRVIACDLPGTDPVPALVEDVEHVRLDRPDRLPFADGAFDAVLSSGTLEHAGSVADSLRELRRVLSPAGRLVIFRFPNQLSISEWVARRGGRWAHGVRMSRSELRFLLRSHGFRVDGMGYDSWLPIWLVRRLRWLRPVRTGLDGAWTGVDGLLVRTPLVARLSTSLWCFAAVNTEYPPPRPGGAGGR